MRKYKKPVIDYKKRRKSLTIPDQALSIQEIVKRFVRGVPVDIHKREPVYVNQSQYDMEKLNRMDFGEKSEFAKHLAADSAKRLTELQEAQRSHELAKAEAAEQAAKAERLKAKKPKDPTP